MISAHFFQLHFQHLPVIINFLISGGLAFCGFFFAYTITQRNLTNKWFKSLKYILTLLSVAALSNSYSLLLLGYSYVQPSELLLNGSVLVLMVWASLYYVVNIRGGGTTLTQEKVLKFIEKEHQATSIN